MTGRPWHGVSPRDNQETSLTVSVLGKGRTSGVPDLNTPPSSTLD